MKATSLQGVKLSKQPGCQGHVSLKGDPGVDLGASGQVFFFFPSFLVTCASRFDWSVLTGHLNLLIRSRAGTDGALPVALGQ